MYGDLDTRLSIITRYRLPTAIAHVLAGRTTDGLEEDADVTRRALELTNNQRPAADPATED